jgi:hypothetical protein
VLIFLRAGGAVVVLHLAKVVGRLLIGLLLLVLNEDAGEEAAILIESCAPLIYTVGTVMLPSKLPPPPPSQDWPDHTVGWRDIDLRF